jgi:hypothetical protein
MNEERQELLFDLLTKKAVYGLDETEQAELDEIDGGMAEFEFESLETTTTAISMVGLETDEPLPAHLYKKIAADAVRFVGPDARPDPWPPAYKSEEKESSLSSWFGWLGWATAAAASVALALNIWFTQFRPPIEIAQAPPAEEQLNKTPAQMRDEMMRSATGMVKANWAAGNVKEMKQVAGDVVWSDEKQTGYVTFRGLPVNDGSKETYQLWIFDKTQDKATPIDGGTFDVTAEGEVVIPITAKLKAQGPEMFAVTVEKPGGVVVSKREKIAAIAKVETQAS